MFFCMALCHTAIVSEHKGGAYGEYISESEDELTLLNSAKQIGFRFTMKQDQFLYIRV